jgi:hypothetical protein
MGAVVVLHTFHLLAKCRVGPTLHLVQREQVSASSSTTFEGRAGKQGAAAEAVALPWQT